MGWATVKEYISTDSEDNKKMKAAKSRALKKRH